MRTLLFAVLTAAVLTSPAFAQTKSQADCEADWKAADTNGDGKLDATEVEAAKANMPASITAAADVMQADFMTACSGQ
jgi:hypothetical protein